LRKEIHTTSRPYKIILEADRNNIKASGKDLSFITVKIVDEKGTTVPDAQSLITFDVQGEGFIAGVDNGDPVSHESFKSNKRKVFNGLALLVVQAKSHPGKIQVKATAEGLQSAELNINVN
jgi:beta-galactosidase